jgi:lycopene cyclase-like protein
VIIVACSQQRRQAKPPTHPQCAEVDSHPFDNDTMLFMDWRDAHLKRLPALRTANEALPTFLYAMPFSDARVFLEETSLVARPGVPFSDLKERMYARLQHMGIKVRSCMRLRALSEPSSAPMPSGTAHACGCRRSSQCHIANTRPSHHACLRIRTCREP